MDAAAHPRGKRPKLVWLVFLFYLFSVSYTALSFYLVLSGSISVAPEQATYLRNLSAFDWTITVLTTTLNLVAAVSLFLLRKNAFSLFASSLALAFLQTPVHALPTIFVAAPAGPGAIGILIGYPPSIAACTHAWGLKARRALG